MTENGTTGWHVDPTDTPVCHRYHALVAAPLAEIRGLSKTDLITRFDALIATPVEPCGNRPWLHRVGPGDYLDELQRRETVRQTRWIIGLTLLIAFLTLVLVAGELGWIDGLRAGSTAAP